VAFSNGKYAHEPTWYRNFLYTEELARGLDATEDLASPGVFEFSLSQKPAVLMLAAEGQRDSPISNPPKARYAQVRTDELHRRGDSKARSNKRLMLIWSSAVRVKP